MEYGTLLIRSGQVDKALEYIRSLKKAEKGIVNIKEIKTDPKIKIPKPDADIMVEVKLNEGDQGTLPRIRNVITQSGRVLGIETIGPYIYEEKKKQ